MIKLSNSKVRMVEVLHDDFLRKPDAGNGEDDYVSTYGENVVKDNDSVTAWP